MKTINKNHKWYKDREQAFTLALIKSVGIHYKNYKLYNNRTVDGFIINKKDNIPVNYIFKATVRECTIDKYPNHVIEKEDLISLLQYYKGGDNILWYINFFYTKENNLYDAIIYRINNRVPIWKKAGSIPFITSDFNTATFDSRTNKTIKEILYLTYDPLMDTIIKNIEVSGYSH